MAEHIGFTDWKDLEVATGALLKYTNNIPDNYQDVCAQAFFGSAGAKDPNKFNRQCLNVEEDCELFNP